MCTGKKQYFEGILNALRSHRVTTYVTFEVIYNAYMAPGCDKMAIPINLKIQLKWKYGFQTYFMNFGSFFRFIVFKKIWVLPYKGEEPKEPF